MIIFGAGIIGEATLRACQDKGIEVECFIDDRIEGPVWGVEVIPLRYLTRRFPQASFYLTSPNIHDMIVPLHNLGYEDWKSCGEILQDFDISKCDWRHSEYSVEHIKYLIRTALHHHENYLKPNLLTVQSVDLVITEKCTMKCKDCSNLMQYYENPENADLNETLQSIDDLCSRMDEIYEVRVIGGEPFVNKDIHIIVEKLTSQEKVRKVAIFTNATVVPRDYQWKALQHEKIRFFITDYDALSRNLFPLTAELEKRGIAYVSEKANDWTECSTLEKHDRPVRENEKLFEQCCAKNLATLADGKLYRCPFAAHAFKLRAVPDYRDDYLIVKDSNSEQIKKFLRGKTYIETCDHCNGRSYGDKLITPAVQTKTPLKYKRYTLKETYGT